MANIPWKIRLCLILSNKYFCTNTKYLMNGWPIQISGLRHCIAK